jgi:hypothetical protein
MKYMILIFFLFTNKSYSNIDVYQWCQAQIDMVKSFSELPAEALIKIKGNIASSDSVESLGVATGNDFLPVIGMTQSHQKISESEARKVVMTMFKPMWITRINEAIAMAGIRDALKWNQLFDKCVYNNRDSL